MSELGAPSTLNGSFQGTAQAFQQSLSTVPLLILAALCLQAYFALRIGWMIPVSIFASRARGAGDPAEAGEYLRHGLALALVIGLAEFAVMALLATQLHRFGQPPEVLAIVLGDRAEAAFRQAMLVSQGDLSVFFANGLVGVGLSFVILAFPARAAAAGARGWRGR